MNLRKSKDSKELPQSSEVYLCQSHKRYIGSCHSIHDISGTEIINESIEENTLHAILRTVFKNNNSNCIKIPR